MDKPLEIPSGIDLNDIKNELNQNEQHHLPPVEEPFDFKEAELDLNQELPPPEVCLTVSGETFATLGNISLLMGKAKTKKTFLTTWLMCQTILQNLKGDKKRVVFIDTEQARYHSLKVGKRVLKLIQLSDHELQDIPFHIYSLRKYDTGQRLQIIEQIIYHYDDLGLLVIDGIRDLVTSINDEEQATDMATRLLRWTEEQNIHIMNVLHQNKGDFNARGHLGTELVNKSETVVSVTKDSNNEDLSKVEAEYTRDKEFPTFAFGIDENGLPVIETDWSEHVEGNSREKLAPHEVDENLHIKVLQKVKRNVDKPSYQELVKQLKLAICELVEKVGDNKSKDYLMYYSNEGFIKKVGKDRSPKSHYEIKPFGGF